MILPGIGCTTMIMGTGAAAGNIGTWNPAAAGPTTVLSNGNLTLGNSTTAYAPALNTIGRSVGKLYAEAVPIFTTFGDIMFGVANASANLGTFIGGDANGLVIYQRFASATSTAIKSNTALASMTPFGSGATIGVAVDFSLGKAWFLVNGVSADGSTIGSTGGYVLPTGTTLFVGGTAAATSGGTGSTLTLNTSPTYGPPSGFTYWV